MLRRSIPSLLRTVAVFLASVQAARAGATTVEARGLGTPLHQSASAVGALRLSTEPRAVHITVLTVATAAVIRRGTAVSARTHVGPSAGRAGMQRAAHASAAAHRVTRLPAAGAAARRFLAAAGASVPSRPLFYGSHGPRSPCS